MQQWVILFRAINVGGKNVLPMGQLTQELERAGFNDVVTYIQSGNVVLRSDAKDAHTLSRQVELLVKQYHDFEPRVMALSAIQYRSAAANNPYIAIDSDPKSTHLYFMTDVPEQPDYTRLETLCAVNEQFELIDNVFYLYAPDGIARSSSRRVQSVRLARLPRLAIGALFAGPFP